ncbi:MarR family winged helix-turn-helix transcriptional regulator [Actinophytocola sp.]|uniref:MarR family winged helix-turn-helix transcriptional regulator n=1 Tax=Actinophytocola sp. TaxID=1872138 RepID=UPI002ED100BC
MADDGRADLAAMLAPLVRALVAAERPILDEHGLTMWGYSVLLALAEQPTRTQAALAESIGADKTRIIGVLDDLQERGLLQRDPDPNDRRVRVLSLTEDGRRVCGAAQADIRKMEETLLARLPAADRRGFLRALRVLSTLPRGEIIGRVRTPDP